MNIVVLHPYFACWEIGGESAPCDVTKVPPPEAAPTCTSRDCSTLSVCLAAALSLSPVQGPEEHQFYQEDVKKTGLNVAVSSRSFRCSHGRLKTEDPTTGSSDEWL